MKKQATRMLAGLIVLTMLLSSIPILAFAEPNSYSNALTNGDFGNYYTQLKSEINNLEISATTSKTNMLTILGNNKEEIERLEMITACGASALNAFASTSEDNKAFLNWLFSNEEAMNKFLSGGTPRDNKVAKALEIWEEIYRTDTESRSGLYLTLAIATALEHANAVNTSWYRVDASGKADVIDPISRYNNFKSAHKAHKLYGVFDTLNVAKMRLVVDAWLTDEDLDWARTTYSGNHSIVSEKGATRDFTTVYDRSNIAKSGDEVEYNTYNAAGISVQNGALNYYGANATLEKVLSVGGVCGAIAKYGTNVAKAFGVPAMPDAQPGHAAGIVNSADGIWTYHNDIYGLGESFTHDGVIPTWAPSTAARYTDNDGKETTKKFGPAYMLLYEAAYSADTTEGKSVIIQSELLRLLAKEMTDSVVAQNVRMIAIELCQYNIQIWRDYITALKADSTFSDWVSVKNKVIAKFSDQPRPMTELLSLFEDQLLAGADDTTKSTYINEIWGIYEAVTDEQQVSVRDVIERSLETWKYEYLPKPTITFSFSGTNEARLMGFIKGMSYSLDGGSTFLAPSDADYKFKINEINNMSCENGILVRNKYSTTVDKSKMTAINITANTGGEISVTGDDLTNSITNMDTTMQFSVNNGVTWTTYDGSNLPDVTGDFILLVRRAGNGLMMPSKAVKVIYTCPNNLAKNKEVTVSSAYSGWKPEYAVDGNTETAWLSGTKTTPQWIYVDLGSIKNVNGVKLKWRPDTYGYAKSYIIQTSSDTVIWKDVFSTTMGDGNTDYINFNMVPARYVRVYATELVTSYKWATLSEFEVYDGSRNPTVWEKSGGTYLSDLVWSNCVHPGKFGPGLDESYNYWGYEKPTSLQLKGTQYMKGLGAYANSTIQYKLDEKYQTFSADIGIDDKATNASPVIFEVIKDATTVYKSEQITDASALQHISVDVTGAKLLTLKVTPIYPEGTKNDNADWANAYLTAASDISNPAVTSIEPSGTDISQATDNIVLHFNEEVTPITGKKIVVANNGTGYFSNVEDGVISGTGSSCMVTIPVNSFVDLDGEAMTIKAGNLYSLLMEKGVFKNIDDHESEAVYGSMDFRIVDGPVITGILPDNTQAVKDIESGLVISFDSTVTAVNGKNVIIGLNAVSYLAQALDSQITGTGSDCKVTIPFTSFKDSEGNPLPFITGKYCSISIEAGAFKNESGTTSNYTDGYGFSYDINLSADDVNDTIIGIDASMEFSINNGVTWKAYTGSNLPDLSENIAIKVRKAAVGTVPVGSITELIFTGSGAENDMVKKLPNRDYLSDLTWSGTPTNGSGSVEKDSSNGASATGDGKNLNINGVTYTKGLGCHADSTVTYDINKNYSRFVTDIGVDNESSGTVQFEVLGDDVSLYKSTSDMTKTMDAVHLDLNVSGVTTIVLKITGGASTSGDHADWAGAYFVLASTSYNVTFNPENGSEATTVTATSGSKISAITEPTKEGYTFGGWYKESECTNAWNFGTDVVAEDTSLYAKWIEGEPTSYNVTFNPENDSEATSVTATSGSKISAITEPTKEGYTFGGWYTESECTNAWNFGTDVVTEDTSLYAKWIEGEPTSYNITFNPENSSEATSVTATSGSKISAITEPTKEGYTFGGWYKESECTNPWDFGTDVVAEDTSLYAKWIEGEPTSYNITFNPENGSEATSVTATSGSKISAITEPTKEGYTFGGWYTESECTNAWNFGTDVVTEDTSLYAKWIEGEPTSYSVTFNPENDSEATSVTATSGSKISAITEPTKEGYTFSGWYKEIECTNAWNFGTDVVTEDTSLYAKWIVDDAGLTSVLGQVIVAGSESGTSMIPKTASIRVSSSVFTVAASDIVKHNSEATVIFYGTDSSFTIPTGGTVNLIAGSETDVYIKVQAADSTELCYKVTISRAAKRSKGGSSDGASTGGDSAITTAEPKQGTAAVIIVNGKEQNVGTETNTNENGKSTVFVEVDHKVIISKIAEAIKNNSAIKNNVIQVSVADTKSDVAKVEFTGDIIKQLEENAFDVSVKRDTIEYIIPAEEFTISKIAENLGLKEKNFADIKVEVKITKLEEKVVEKYNEVVKTNGAELVFPPVSFEVLAKTTKADGTTGEVEISKFSNYVERVMEIPAGVDPSKNMTGIVFNADGTYSHVPTEVYQKDGKWYAKLRSLTNSDYSVIYNTVTVKSVENHWAKDTVNDMASRLIIFNPEAFEPDKAITRADFAEYIVRALGIYREGSNHENNFKDVNSTGERTLAILIANEYGIVSGYADGTFRGDNLITREEAMVMYQRAMKTTKLVGSDENRYQSYTDYNQVSEWATTCVKEVLSAHVFNGTTATTISPKSSLTYAESAQAIKNLLVESKLISK